MPLDALLAVLHLGQCCGRLLWHHAVAESSELLRARDAYVGDPAHGKAHHPLDKRGREPVGTTDAWLGRTRGRSGHLLPAPDSLGIGTETVRLSKRTAEIRPVPVRLPVLVVVAAGRRQEGYRCSITSPIDG